MLGTEQSFGTFGINQHAKGCLTKLGNLTLILLENFPITCSLKLLLVNMRKRFDRFDFLDSFFVSGLQHRKAECYSMAKSLN